MFKSLSRSILIMFVYDLLILTISTYSIGYLLYSNSQDLITRVLQIILVVIAGLFSFFLKGQYKIREFNNTFKNAWLLLEGCIFANIPAGILLFFFVPKTILAKFLVLNILTIFVCLKLYRICFHKYLFDYKKVKKVLIVGANERAKAVVDAISNKEALRMEVVGIVKSAQIDKAIWEGFASRYNLTVSEIEKLEQENDIKEEENFNCKGLTVFEDGKYIIDIMDKTTPDIIVFATNSHLVPVIGLDIPIYRMEEFYEMATGKFYVHEDLMPKFLTEFAIWERSCKGKTYKVCKRIYDIIAALIILIVTLPVTSYIALRVWLIDFKSPFFTQTRTGLKGKPFECYKLRTMYSNDYVPKNAEMLNDGSDRVIPFCKFVRKAKLDEIPQMVNILKGEMSIVGPRAEWNEFTNVFKNDVPFHQARTLVKAGWTGWAHVSMPAAYSVDEEKERLAYDLYYIKHRNVLWEIGILVKAVFLAISGRHL